jgi:uncharacterized protein YbaP (TraB family)
MLWKVTSPKGHTGYLAGSVHVIKNSIYPLSPIFRRAFKQSDQLVFELNIDSLKANRLSLLLHYGYLPEGTTLKDKLPPETYKLLKSKLDSLGLPVSRMQRLKPWLAAVTVMDLTLMKAGYGKGIDWHFFLKAKEAGKPRIGLETPAFQMSLLNKLGTKFTDDFVKSNLQKGDRILKNVNKLVTAWKQGRVIVIDSLVNGVMRKKDPVLYKQLVLKRNHKWMPKIERMFDGPKTTMVIVGAGHIVGKNGLAALLRKQGYQVEQL